MTQAESKPIHIVTARWGSKPCGVHKGYAPDWRVHWVQRTDDPVYPYYVRVTYNPSDPYMTNPCTWRVPEIYDNPRYDFTDAVELPNLALDSD